MDEAPDFPPPTLEETAMDPLPPPPPPEEEKEEEKVEAQQVIR